MAPRIQLAFNKVKVLTIDAISVGLSKTDKKCDFAEY